MTNLSVLQELRARASTVERRATYLLPPLKPEAGNSEGFSLSQLAVEWRRFIIIRTSVRSCVYPSQSLSYA